MSQFKIEGGSFGTGIGHFGAGGFSLPSGKFFNSTHIASSSIESAELASAESLKRLGGTLGWGAVGLVALGPLGMFAGLLAGGRKNLATFIVGFKDGRVLIGTADAKVWVAIKSAAVTASARKPNFPAPLAAVTDSTTIAPSNYGRDGKGMLSEACATWGWTLSIASKQNFKRFEVVKCWNANRVIAVAVTNDPVTAYSFSQMERELNDITEAQQRVIVAPSIGQSLSRELRSSGISYYEPSKIAETVARW